MTCLPTTTTCGHSQRRTKSWSPSCAHMSSTNIRTPRAQATTTCPITCTIWKDVHTSFFLRLLSHKTSYYKLGRRPCRPSQSSVTPLAGTWRASSAAAGGPVVLRPNTLFYQNSNTKRNSYSFYHHKKTCVDGWHATDTPAAGGPVRLHPTPCFSYSNFLYL